MTLRTQRLMQQIILFAVVLAMMLTHNSSVGFNARVMMTAVALGAAVVISFGLRKANLLVSPLDYGWLPYVLLTGLSVLFAATPRRSLESWLWFIGIQLPISYGALYLFRRRWAEQGLFRALLGTGGYLYLLTASLTLNFLSQWQAARAQGITPPGFRLFGVMEHPNIFAMFIAISTPCIVAYLFVRMKWIERAACILWLAGAVFAIYATGSRTGLVATIVGLCLAVVMGLLAHPAQPLSRFGRWVAAHRPQATALIVTGGVVALIVLGITVYLQLGRPRQDDGGGRLNFYKAAITMFEARPLLGYGPGGFVRDEIQTHSVPPYSTIMPHAHDMLLNTAAESGTLGLIGFLALLTVGAWVCYKAWRTQPTRRQWIAGPIAGLVAFCMVGILDSPINQFGPFFLATLLLAFIAAKLPAPQVSSRVRKGLIIAAIWSVVLLCVLVLIPYSTVWGVTRPDAPPEDAAALVASAQRLDQIAVYDNSDPLVTLQSAYAWANAVALDKAAPDQWLQNAIARLERGVQLDPDLGIHAINLSALYLQAGRTDDAIRAAQQATADTPDDAVAWLNLGIALEKAGQTQPAQTAYLRALTAEPRWSAMGFWELSPARKQAYEAYTAMPEAGKRYYDLLYSGDAARRAGHKDEAIKAYQSALKVVAGNVAATYVQGLIALANNDLAAARIQMANVTTKDIIYDFDQPPFVDAWLSLGDFARDDNDIATMLKDYTIAYTFLISRGMSGLGSKGNWSYATLGYQRFARINDYLPGVVMIDISPEQALRFKVLAQAIAKSGNTTTAQEIYQHILQSNPNDDEARALLAQLTG